MGPGFESASLSTATKVRWNRSPVPRGQPTAPVTAIGDAVGNQGSRSQSVSCAVILALMQTARPSTFASITPVVLVVKPTNYNIITERELT